MRASGCARRSSVAAVAKFGSVDQDRNPRRFEQIIGNSRVLESVLEQVGQVAPTDSTVLIQGETVIVIFIDAAATDIHTLPLHDALPAEPATQTLQTYTRVAG